MMEFPEDLRYTKAHEWLRRKGPEAVIGITDFAQDALGDVVFVELPAVDTQLTQGQTFGVVESNKTVSDLFAPVSGRVLEVNQVLRDEPWMIRVAPSRNEEIESLLDAAAYRAFVASEQKT